MADLGRTCGGLGGEVEKETEVEVQMKDRIRTLAKSFASWPPWLMAGYQCRVAAELSPRLHAPGSSTGPLSYARA